MPTISVIVSAWRAQDFIDRAIASARAQTLSDIEILVIDDASPDGTAEAARTAAQGDPRVLVTTLPANKGPAGARNAALAMARGEWAAVLDADDTMAPDRLETLLARAKTANADIVADDMLVVQEGVENAAFLNLAEAGEMTLAAFARGNQLFRGNRQTGYLKPMFRTAFLRRYGLVYDDAVRIGEDYVLVAHALAHGARYVLHPAALYRYSVQAGSISRRMSRADVESLIAADDRFQAAHADALEPDAKAALKQRRASLEDASSYIGIVDALKAGRVDRAIGEAVRRPSCMRHLHMPVRARIERLLGRGGGMAAAALVATAT